MNNLFEANADSGTTLSEMTTRANESYQQSRESAKKAIEHAVECGRHLVQIKSALRHGEFQRWLENHFAGSKRTAQQYMRLANNPAIAEKSSSVSGAVALLQSPKERTTKSAGHSFLNGDDPRVQFVVLQMRRVIEIKRQLAVYGCTVSDTGAVFDKNITLEAYESCGKLLGEMSRLIPLIDSAYQTACRELREPPQRTMTHAGSRP